MAMFVLGIGMHARHDGDSYDDDFDDSDSDSDSDSNFTREYKRNQDEKRRRQERDKNLQEWSSAFVKVITLALKHDPLPVKRPFGHVVSPKDRDSMQIQIDQKVAEYVRYQNKTDNRLFKTALSSFGHAHASGDAHTFRVQVAWKQLVDRRSLQRGIDYQVDHLTFMNIPKINDNVMTIRRNNVQLVVFGIKYTGSIQDELNIHQQTVARRIGRILPKVIAQLISTYTYPRIPVAGVMICSPDSYITRQEHAGVFHHCRVRKIAPLCMDDTITIDTYDTFDGQVDYMARMKITISSRRTKKYKYL
jgi:hypothetical protein